jgi:hypothetical protein
MAELTQPFANILEEPNVRTGQCRVRTSRLFCPDLHRKLAVRTNPEVQAAIWRPTDGHNGRQNYPGFSDIVADRWLIEQMHRPAGRSGATIVSDRAGRRLAPAQGHRGGHST